MHRRGHPIEISALTATSTVAIAILGVALGALFDMWWSRMSWATVRRSAVSTAIGWAAFLAAWSLAGETLDPALVLPLAAVSGVGVVLVSTPAHVAGLSFGVTSIVGALWALIAYSPITIVSFTTVSGVFATGYIPLDLGGAFAGLIAAGASGAAFLLVHRHRDTSTPPAVARRRRAPLIGVFAVVWALWILWLVGLDLVVSSATPRILLNTVLGPLSAAAAWLVVQRIRHAKTTVEATLGGLLCGLVALTPSSGYIEAIGAITTGAIAGSVCSLVGYSVARRRGQTSWLLVILLLVGGTIGAVLVGVFAIRSGLIVTGQPETILSQLASTGLTIGYSLVVSLLLWWGAQHIGGALARTRGRSQLAPRGGDVQ